MANAVDTSALSAFFSQFFPFDPFELAFREDPYPTFRGLHETGPVIRTTGGAWAVVGHRECSAVLRDPRFGHGDAVLVSTQVTHDADGNEIRPFIFMDPPDHTRVRGLVSKTFAGRIVERLRPRAEKLVVELLDEARRANQDVPIDLMASIAFPMPSVLIGEVLGVPAEDHQRFRTWSNALARGLDPDFLLTPEEIERRNTSRAEFDAYFFDLAEQRLAEPAEDLVSALVVVEEQGEGLARGELVGACRLLLSAGYVSTAHLIGNGMLALLRHPDQLEWLRAHPDQIGPAVEELLRYDAPVQMTSVRVALEDADILGLPVKQGDPVIILVGAANHDPTVYENPERLDLSRKSGRNMAFGLGIHFCIGAPLARLTAQVAISALIQLSLELCDDDPPHMENLVLRGVTELPVRVRELTSSDA